MNQLHYSDLVNIAYVAPEIPALSATFVYDEMFALERKGIHVLPISVHFPQNPALEQINLLERTYYLYKHGFLDLIGRGVFDLFAFPLKNIIKSFYWLISDILELGILKSSSWKLGYQFLVSIRLAKILSRNHCKHIHVHFAHVPTQIAMYASGLTNIPFSVTAHANDIFERGTLLVKKADRSKKFLTISQYNIDYLIAKGVAPEKLGIVRCSVDFEIQTFRVRSKRIKIGSLGRLVEKKGMDILLLAIEKLVRRGFEVRLEIAGDGPQRELLQRMTQTLAIEDHVEFIGSLRHDEVSDWMKTLDIFVLACKKDVNGDQDGIPVVLMEAMAMGIPVISTRISGIPELIIDGKTGQLALPDDPESLSDRISRLITDNEVARNLVKYAQSHVVTEFGRETNLGRLLEVFDVSQYVSTTNT